MNLDYILNSMLWSMAGLLIGFFAGFMARDVHEIKETVMEDRTHNATPIPLRPRRVRRDFPPNLVLGIAMIVLALITVLMGAASAHDSNMQAQCFRNYNAKFAEAFTARAKAADDDRTALNTMLVSMGNPKLTQQGRAKVYFTYLDQIKASDAQRKAHPLPQPPDPNEACKNS